MDGSSRYCETKQLRLQQQWQTFSAIDCKNITLSLWITAKGHVFFHILELLENSSYPKHDSAHWLGCTEILRGRVLLILLMGVLEGHRVNLNLFLLDHANHVGLIPIFLPLNTPWESQSHLDTSGFCSKSNSDSHGSKCLKPKVVTQIHHMMS